MPSFPMSAFEGYQEWFEASGLGYAVEKEIIENLDTEQVDLQTLKCSRNTMRTMMAQLPILMTFQMDLNPLKSTDLQ